MTGKKQSTYHILLNTRDCRVASRTDQHILLILALHGSKTDPAISWPSVECLARETGYSDRTLQRSLQRLKALGLLKTKRRMNSSNKYKIEVSFLAEAAETAKAALRAKRQVDLDGWDDDLVQSKEEPDADAQEQDSEWTAGLRLQATSAIAAVPGAQYLVAKYFSEDTPNAVELSSAIACATMAQAEETVGMFLGSNENLSETFDRLVDQDIECEGFYIHLRRLEP